jgi:hypothetical protein
MAPIMKRITIRRFSESLFFTALLAGQLAGQTAVTGNQIHLTAELHTTTSYTVLPGDCGKLLSFSSGSATTITIPPATLSSMRPGCWMDFQNTGAGSATITPSGSTIDGLSTATLDAGHSIHMVYTGGGFLSTHDGGQAAAAAWTNRVIGSSTSPVFAAGGQSGITFLYTLTGDVTSSSLTGPAPGVYVFAITQDSTGGHAFAWPSNIINAPAVDAGPQDTTYLLCQYDGTSCVGIGNFATGGDVVPGVTIPGALSGYNTIAPPAAAGTGSRTNLAPNGTTVIPNNCGGQFVQSIDPTGAIGCGAA